MVHKTKSQTYLGVISHFGEADSSLKIFKAKSDDEAYEKAEEYEVSALVRLDPSKVAWLKKRLGEL